MINILICVGSGNIETIKITIFHKSMIINKRLRIRKGQSKIDNPEKLVTYKCMVHNTKKNTTQYVLDTAIRKQTQIT